MRDYDEGVPQAASGEQFLRERRRRLLPEMAHPIEAGPRRTGSTLTWFNPPVARVWTVRDNTEQDQQVRLGPDGLEGAIDVPHERFVVGNVVVRR